jgi:molybdenum cofactor cytidylyltransferase
MNNPGIIILAAGSSSRLGRPKQLLPWKGSTLINHITREALQAPLQPIIIVTGAFAKEVNAALEGEPVVIAHNPQWSQGMASSIVKGISTLLTMTPGIDAVVIAVCDQPFLSAEILRSLADSQQPDHPIVACTYENTIATPALFHRSLFRELLMLNGDTGAKKIIREHRDKVTTIPFPMGHLDIDTIEAYEDVLKMS